MALCIVTCPKCKDEVHIPQEWLGRWVSCMHCGMQFAAMEKDEPAVLTTPPLLPTPFHRGIAIGIGASIVILSTVFFFWPRPASTVTVTVPFPKGSCREVVERLQSAGAKFQYSARRTTLLYLFPPETENPDYMAELCETLHQNGVSFDRGHGVRVSLLPSADTAREQAWIHGDHAFFWGRFLFQGESENLKRWLPYF